MLPTRCELPRCLCVPLAGLASRSRRPRCAEALVSRCASFPALYLAEPLALLEDHGVARRAKTDGVIPGCFPCVTVESTILGCLPRQEAGNRDFQSVLPSRPAAGHACTHLQGVSPLACTVRSARTFVSGILKVLFPVFPFPSTTLHVTYHGAGLAR